MLDSSNKDIEEIQIMRVAAVDNTSPWLKIFLWILGVLLIGVLLYFAWKGMTMGNQSSSTVPVHTVKVDNSVIHTKQEAPIQEKVVEKTSVKVEPMVSTTQETVVALVPKPVSIEKKKEVLPVSLVTPTKVETIVPVVATKTEIAPVATPTVTDAKSMELQQLVQVVQLVMTQMNNQKVESAQIKNNTQEEVTLQSEAIVAAMVNASTSEVKTIVPKEVAKKELPVELNVEVAVAKEIVQQVPEKALVVQSPVVEVKKEIVPVVNKPQAVVNPTPAPTQANKLTDLQALLSSEIDSLSEEEVNSLTTILSGKAKKTTTVTKKVDTYNKVIRKKEDRVNSTDLLSQIAKDIASVVDAPETTTSMDKYTTSIKKEVSTRVNAMRYVVVKSGDTLGKIAHKAYGNASQYKRIFVANPDILRRADQIFIGQRLRVPL